MAAIKKIFPHSCTKKKLVEMYLGMMPEKKIRKEINEIILDKRKSIDKEIQSHFITNVELLEFVKIYGLPENYKQAE